MPSLLPSTLRSTMRQPKCNALAYLVRCENSTFTCSSRLASSDSRALASAVLFLPLSAPLPGSE